MNFYPGFADWHVALWSDGVDEHLFHGVWRPVAGGWGVKWEQNWSSVDWKDDATVVVFLYNTKTRERFFAPAPNAFVRGECYVTDRMLWQREWHHLAVMFRWNMAGYIDRVSPTVWTGTVDV